MRLDSSRAPRRSTISLTPLIDVVFILLLFFMLTSRFEQYRAIDLNVTANDSTTTTSSSITPLMLKLHSDGRVSINGTAPIEHNELASNLAIQEAVTQQLPVYVNSGADVTLSTLTQLMDELSASGITAISFKGIR